MKVSDWGNYPIIESDIRSFSAIKDLRNVLSDFQSSIPRGLGRCYGDSALWRKIVSSLKFNRMLEFREEQGILTCEAGASLKEIVEVFVPRGWFLPVTPGTKHVTVGGAIASDVHGKNHHKEGAFSDHLVSVDIMLPEGSVITCSKTENPEIYRGLCGGMGLTGIILKATLKLKKIESAYIKQKVLKARDINEVMEMFEKYDNMTYSVAWIDCLAKGRSSGRSILMLGEHATAGDIKGLVPANPLAVKEGKPLHLPFSFPGFILNSFTAKAFNSLYYFRKPKEQDSIVDHNAFFFPLDSIDNWNKLYGRAGFLQYQFVLPEAVAAKGLKEILGRIGNSGMGSFLAVLKLMGKENSNLISFPMKGYTLALDFPITAGLFPFLDELDKIVLEYGGRLYLAKDSRMSSDMFRQSYKRAEEFASFKYKIDREGKFRSLQSERLGF